jgi:uncharacterized protein
MNTNITYTAFQGHTSIAGGELTEVLLRVQRYLSSHPETNPLIFRNDTGKQVDFDLSGTREELLARYAPRPQRKGPGRPKLGVVCNEICLLPKHWEWLERQPRKASAVIRRLIDTAMKNPSPEEILRDRIEAAHSFMWAIAGDLSGFEEASRALYAGKWEIFDRLIAPWPEDVVGTINTLLGDARELTG